MRQGGSESWCPCLKKVTIGEMEKKSSEEPEMDMQLYFAWIMFVTWKFNFCTNEHPIPVRSKKQKQKQTKKTKNKQTTNAMEDKALPKWTHFPFQTSHKLIIESVMSIKFVLFNMDGYQSVV